MSRIKDLLITAPSELGTPCDEFKMIDEVKMLYSHCPIITRGVWSC